MATLPSPLVENDHGSIEPLHGQWDAECSQQQKELWKASHCRDNVKAGAQVVMVVLTPRDGTTADLKLVNLSTSPMQSIDQRFSTCDSFSRAQASGGNWDKALRKNEVSTLRMLCFLGANHIAALGHSSSPKAIQFGHTHVSVDPDGIFVRPLQSTGLSVENHSLLYRKVLFSHRSSSLCNSSQLLHCRSSDLSQLDRMYDVAGRPNFDEVYVVSGLCLFNASILRQVKELYSGKTTGLTSTSMEQIVERETLYEAEIVWRLSSSIADLASLIIAGSHTSRSFLMPELPRPTIKIDVARLEYYGLGLTMIEKGLWDFKDALAWIAIVDRRVEQLLDRFSCALKDAMRARELDGPALWELCISNGAAASEELLRESLHQGYIPSSADFLSSLATARNQVWQKFISLLQEDELPQDIRDLARLSYVYEYLHPILGSGVGQQAIVLAVDDSDEQRIFLGAQKFLRRFRSSHPSPKHLLLACYPHSRISINSTNGQSNLYHHDFRHAHVPALMRKEPTGITNASFSPQQIVRLARYISKSDVVTGELA